MGCTASRQSPSGVTAAAHLPVASGGAWHAPQHACTRAVGLPCRAACLIPRTATLTAISSRCAFVKRRRSTRLRPSRRCPSCTRSACKHTCSTVSGAAVFCACSCHIRSVLRQPDVTVPSCPVGVCSCRDLADGSVELCCAPETESAIFANGPRAGAEEKLPLVKCTVTVGVGGRDAADGPARVAPVVAKGVPQGRLETCVRALCSTGRFCACLAYTPRTHAPACHAVVHAHVTAMRSWATLGR
jgi:hypothetical protein